MMDKAVDHGCGHLVIRKDTAPFRELQICGKNQAFTFVTVGYNPE